VKITKKLDECGKEDIDRLKNAGLDDKTIHDAVQVIAYFNYITRIATPLGSMIYIWDI